MLSDEMKNIVQLEIANDPSNRGYAGKTAAEQVVLLNGNYEIAGPTILMPPRISTVFVGVAAAPNAIDETDLLASLGQ